MRTIGRKVAQVDMRTGFDRIVDIGGIAWFKCKVHKDIPPMNRKRAREHYMLYG